MMWIIAGVLVLAAMGAVYQALSTRSDLRNYPALGQLVDVGGYKLHLYCVGTNTDARTAVIRDEGLGGTYAAWARVQSQLAQSTRVCAYDRAGMGWSDSGSE